MTPGEAFRLGWRSARDFVDRHGRYTAHSVVKMFDDVQGEQAMQKAIKAVYEAPPDVLAALDVAQAAAIESGAWESYAKVGEAFDRLRALLSAVPAEPPSSD